MIEVNVAEESSSQRIAVQKFRRKGIVFKRRGRVGVRMLGMSDVLQYPPCGPKVRPNGLVLVVLESWSRPPFRSAIPFDP